MQHDITSELNQAIALTEKLNDILYNLAIDYDAEDQFTPESYEKLKEIKEHFTQTPTSQSIIDHLEALIENFG